MIHLNKSTVAGLCLLTAYSMPAPYVLAEDAGSILTPVRLRCEYLVDPLGIDVPWPRLSWVLQTRGRAADRKQYQTAYRVLVASDRERLAKDQGDLWDSGKVESGASIQVEYAGKPLASRSTCYWKVRVWDRNAKASAWSSTATWEMGLLGSGDWKAKWINDGRPTPTSDADFFKDDPAPLFRKEFQVDKPVQRARLYMAGLGYGYARINGERVGDRVLATAWTDFAQRVLYDTYDVTEQIKHGTNCLGMTLGNGWYNPLPLKMWGRINLREHLAVGRPRGIVQLEIEYADGSRKVVATDTTWKTAPGPVLRNNIYLGEIYDARQEPGPWDCAGFDDSAWSQAAVPSESIGRLCSRMHPPVRVTATLKPVLRTEPKPGVFVFDMGQNFAGWVRLRVSGPKGTAVKLRFGEILYPDGTLNVMTSVCGQIKKGKDNWSREGPRLAYQSDTYVLSGRGEEVYTPRFTWHGFRYVEVTGYPGTPPLDSVEGLRLSADINRVGTFTCSNERFNRIQRITEWTFLSNVFDVQSDCPHRERFGYGGDLVASCEAFLFNFDMAGFYTKVVRDFADAARPQGGITELAPFTGIADKGLGDQSGPIGWQLAFPILQEKLYQFHGDKRLIGQQYPAMRRLIAFLRGKAEEHIIAIGISDHESIAPKPIALTGTAFYYHHVTAAARFAEILGNQDDALEYRELAARIRAAFLTKFFHPDTGRFLAGTQACQAFALHYDMLPQRHRAAVVHTLVDAVRTRHEGHLSTGIFGTRYLLETLSRTGHAKIAHEIANQETWPGWGYMLDSGATTLWEHWQFSEDHYSHNHPAFGSVSAWFFEDVAGIRADPHAVGFDRVIVQPRVTGGLSHARATFDSIRGPIRCRWEIQGTRLRINLAVPPGVTATVYVPTDDLMSVTESGNPASKALGVDALAPARNAAVFRVLGGVYQFEAAAPELTGAQ